MLQYTSADQSAKFPKWNKYVFVAIMFTVALIITNFANNAAMAVVLMPVVLTFSNQIGINPMPVAMGVILIQ